jgi:hypothetical protein
MKTRLVEHACNPSYSGGRSRGRKIMNSRLIQAVSEPLSQKQNTQKGCGVAQEVEHLQHVRSPRFNLQ